MPYITVIIFTDLSTMFKRIKAPLKQAIDDALVRLEMLKFDVILKILFRQSINTEEHNSCYFHIKIHLVSRSRDTASMIVDSFTGLNKQIENYIERRSGWVVESIEQLDVHISKYQPIRGSS